MEHYDIIIIGTGAGGGTLARQLAPSGKKILLIERGGYLPREKENWEPESVFADNRYTSPENWLDKDGNEFHPGIHYFVGGNTKMYGAALIRFREEDFQQIRHHDGISPAWPIAYQDLAPYYTQAEKMYHVHGQSGIDPTEPEREPFPYPAVKHEPRIRKLYNDLEKIGHRPFPLPLGLILNEENREKSKCIKCNTCDGFPCLVHAKADAHVVGVQPALEHNNVTLMTHTLVEKLCTNPSGRTIQEIIIRENDESRSVAADIVVVSCGAINSAALLLRSANDRHPNGLANSSGCVGRHYMCHNNSAFIALSREPNPTKFQKTLGLNDYYLGADDFKYPLGHIQMLGKSMGPMFKGDAPWITPEIALDKMAEHAIDFWLCTEDLPDPENRVIIEKNGQIRIQYKENNLEPHRRLQDKLKKILKAIDCKERLIPRHLYLGKKIPIGGTAHQNGTVRFGTDPASSALDVNCKAHDHDNLYVVDGSFFVSSTSVNPALTIAANAIRVGDHLLQRLQAGAGSANY